MEESWSCSPENQSSQAPSSRAVRDADAGQHRASKQSEPPLRKSRFWTHLGIGFTILLAILIGLVVLIYVKKENMTRAQKHIFETLTTGLLLFLGLNFAVSCDHDVVRIQANLILTNSKEAFKDLADHSHKLILARSQWARQHEATVNEISSFKTVMELAASRVPATVRLVAIGWLLLNILAQIAVALVSLTYSTRDGTDFNGIYTRSGTVSVANTTCFLRDVVTGCNMSRPDIAVSAQGRAHAYGQFGEAEQCCPYNETTQILSSNKDCLYWCRRHPGKQEFGFRFNEYNRKDTTKVYPHFTNRIMTASSGPCTVYNQSTDPAPKPADDGYTRYYYHNATFKDYVDIPFEQTAIDGTTYLYRGDKTPQETSRYACGPRCLVMWAFMNQGHGVQPRFYQCPITITNVTNVTNERTQSISDATAKVAAAAIGLQGRRRGDMSWSQSQLYTFGTIWEVRARPNPDHVGANIAEFALASLAWMARNQPPILTPGTVPHLGTRIDVRWGFLVALLAGIALVHLGLWWATSWLSKGGGSGGGGGRGGIGGTKGYVQVLELNEREGTNAWRDSSTGRKGRHVGDEIDDI